MSLQPPIGVYDHCKGRIGTEFSIVEYGDYECPYCRAAVPVIDEVLERLGDRVVFAFRHFPLADLHPYALSAAVAAEAAALKGQFWEMHDLLFSGAEPRLTQDDIRGYAEQLGIPPAKVLWPTTRFVEEPVEAHFNSGVRSGVRGTPTLFVNGEIFRGSITVERVLSAVIAVPAATT